MDTNEENTKESEDTQDNTDKLHSEDYVIECDEEYVKHLQRLGKYRWTNRYERKLKGR
jgi:hypothetical protein